MIWDMFNVSLISFGNVGTDSKYIDWLVMILVF